MTVLEKINLLVDKQNGVGLSKTLIAKYCGQHFNSIDYYLKGAQISPDVEKKYQNGLNNLLKDIQNIILK